MVYYQLLIIRMYHTNPSISLVTGLYIAHWYIITILFHIEVHCISNIKGIISSHINPAFSHVIKYQFLIPFMQICPYYQYIVVTPIIDIASTPSSKQLPMSLYVDRQLATFINNTLILYSQLANPFSLFRWHHYYIASYIATYCTFK